MKAFGKVSLPLDPPLGEVCRRLVVTENVHLAKLPSQSSHATQQAYTLCGCCIPRNEVVDNARRGIPPCATHQRVTKPPLLKCFVRLRRNLPNEVSSRFGNAYQ